ncbi:hypothetical protein TNCV_4927421 [Trichonephila clavipes]|nr:hypothetical protein TNCV_4927421 [Trichonephila clavipes]
MEFDRDRIVAYREGCLLLLDIATPINQFQMTIMQVENRWFQKAILNSMQDLNGLLKLIPCYENRLEGLQTGRGFLCYTTSIRSDKVAMSGSGLSPLLWLPLAG